MPADHGQTADATELVHGHGAGHERPVLDDDMAAKQGGVGEDAVVAHHHIVAEVRSRHHVIVVTDHRRHVGLQRAVDRHVFAEHVVVADHHAADLLRPGHVLRRPADHGVLAEFVVAAGADARLDVDARGDVAEIAEFHAGFDGGESPDRDSDPESGIRTDDGQRMDAH